MVAAEGGRSSNAGHNDSVGGGPSTGALGSGTFSLASLLDGEAGAQQDPKREPAVRGAQIPHTILRVGQIRDSPGGTRELLFSQVHCSLVLLTKPTWDEPLFTKNSSGAPQVHCSLVLLS